MTWMVFQSALTGNPYTLVCTRICKLPQNVVGQHMQYILIFRMETVHQRYRANGRCPTPRTLDVLRRLLAGVVSTWNYGAYALTARNRLMTLRQL